MDTDTPETDRDRALENTFPASDPPATGGSTGPNDKSGRKPPEGNDPPLAQGVLPAQN